LFTALLVVRRITPGSSRFGSTLSGWFGLVLRSSKSSSSQALMPNIRATRDMGIKVFRNFILTGV
jgi:hypothetical protein